MRASYAARAYSSVDLTERTESRRPEELVVLLFDKACACLRRASMLPVQKLDTLSIDERLPLIEDFHKQTGKALQIVVALREMLDTGADAQTSNLLADTYTAISQGIWAATKTKNTDDLAKLYTAMTELRAGWETIANA